MKLASGRRHGFTLIEVMMSMAVVAIALVALLSLQHQTLQSIIRANQLTTAAGLAQELMTEAEMQTFPPLGDTKGDFQSMHSGQYHDFRWERDVEASAVFPDIRTVHVRVYFGRRFGRRFDLTELMRNPLPNPGL